MLHDGCVDMETPGAWNSWYSCAELVKFGWCYSGDFVAETRKRCPMSCGACACSDYSDCYGDRQCVDKECRTRADIEECSILPVSMNGAEHGYGCPGAVSVSDTPMYRYCVGDDGKFPWWAKCC